MVFNKLCPSSRNDALLETNLEMSVSVNGISDERYTAQANIHRNSKITQGLHILLRLSICCIPVGIHTRHSANITSFNFYNSLRYVFF